MANKSQVGISIIRDIPIDAGIFEDVGRLVSDGVIGDFVTLIVELFGQPVIVPLVGDVESSSDRTAVGIQAPSVEDLLVESGDEGGNGRVEPTFEKLKIR